MKAKQLNLSPKPGLLLLAPLLVALSIGCSRETKVYQDPLDPVSIDDTTEPPITTDGRALLPTGFYNQSVNCALVDVALDGATADSKAIRLQTLPGTNDVGSFNGTGQGNRALLGLAPYGDVQLSMLTGITFDSKSLVGTETVSVHLIVDLACDGTSIRVLTANKASLGSGTSVADGYTRFSALLNEARWKANGAAITDPDDGSVTLVAGTADASASALDAFLVKYPAACLKNTASGDDDMPKSLPTAAVLFSLGDSSTTTANTAFIKRITVGDDVYDGLE